MNRNEEVVLGSSHRYPVTQQCRATCRNTGEQCKRMCPPGYHVCHKHGAHLPSVKKAARQRLEFLTHPAVERIAQFVEEGGHDPSIVLRACQLVLDRTGFGPQVKIEQSTAGPEHEDLVAEMTDEEFAIVDEIMLRVKARLDAKAKLLAEPGEDLSEEPPGDPLPTIAVRLDEGNQESPPPAPSPPPDEEEFG